MRIAAALCVICATQSAGQEMARTEIDFAAITDALIPFQDDDTDYEVNFENQAQLLAHPLDVNKAGAAELRMLHLLSEPQIESIIRHRQTHGNFISLYELQSVNGLDPATIQKLVSFLTVSDPETSWDHSLLKRVLKNNNHYVMMRYEQTLERVSGFKHIENRSPVYSGSPGKISLRYRNSRPHDFSIGIAAEKDAGEKLRWNPARHQFAADHLSYHMQFMDKGRIKNLIVGDFQPQFGQGLQLGGGFGLGKSSEPVVTTRRCDVGFLPYSAMNESGFMRGAAGSISVSPRVMISGFFSMLKKDAALMEDDKGNRSISSFLTSGLHRSETEMARRKNAREMNVGGIVQYRVNHFDAGVIVHATDFSAPVMRAATPYNAFSFAGKRNLNVGYYTSFTYRNASFFSEVARSSGGGTGLLAGTLASLGRHVEIAMLYRRYARNFHSFYSNALSENTSPQNESGMYWGWKYQIKKLGAAGYADLFVFPWLRFRSYAPSAGHEWLFRLSYQPTRSLTAYMQARQERKNRNVETMDALYQTRAGAKNNYIFYLGYRATKTLRLNTRAQFSTYSIAGKQTSGMLVLQDIIAEFGKFQFTCRHAIFDTDDFNNRQYVYENDVWLAYSLPFYHGVGLRNYVLTEYKIHKRLSLWIRYARTRYHDQDNIGNGHDKIDGNTRNDIKFQALFKL